MRMTGGSLFSGIGGAELGAEMAGIDIDWLWQVEIEPYRRGILSKRCPARKQLSDVREATGLPRVDVLVGGFPCKDLSDAGRGRQKGLEGEQSGLWTHMLRIIQEGSPPLVVIENVDGGAWRRYLPIVRRDLWRAGYASMPIRVRANQIGAPHRGSRIFTIASTNLRCEPAGAINGQMAELQEFADSCGSYWGQPPPEALGMADGIPHGLDRVRACGDSFVPQCMAVVWKVAMAIKGEADG